MEGIADKYGTRCHVITMPVSLQSKKASFQATARQWRHTESENILDAKRIDTIKGSYIATAHHREDQLESLLLKLIRGVHISNFLPVSSVIQRRSVLYVVYD